MRTHSHLISFIILLGLMVIGCEQELQDLQQPEVLILSPLSDAKIRVDSTFIIRVEANDNIGIEEVELLVDGEVIDEDENQPFEFEVEELTLSLGDHSILAKAFDPSGNIGTSSVVNIEITKKPRNILTGIVSNALGEGIAGAEITISTSKQKSSVGTDSYVDHSAHFVSKELLFGQTPYSRKGPNIEENEPIKTDSEGRFEILDLAEGKHDISAKASGYSDLSQEITQTEGTVEYAFQMSMLENLQVSAIQLEDRNYSIKAKWNPISLSTIEGYNIYEQHIYFSELEGQETRTHISPVYSDWKKVNESPVDGNSYEFETEEFNAIYGIYVLPVTRDGVESEFTDNTDKDYLTLPFNRRHFRLFNLTPLSSPLFIENNTHDYALHMRFFYEIVPFGVNNWEVLISEDKTSWEKLGELSTSKGQEPGYMKKNDYGYYQSVSLNQYKGKLVYFKTNPESGNINMELENFIGEYSQDGTALEPFGEPPVAGFSASHTILTEGTSVQFSDESTNEPTSWLWDFGDGETSQTQNPAHTYTTPGLYTVSLTSSNQYGTNKTTQVDYITVKVKGYAPEAEFEASETKITVGESTTFTDQSTHDPTNWAWIFGDGYTSSDQNPTHTYSTAGTYTISLMASNEFGNDTEIKNDYIVAGLVPAADFSADRTTVFLGEPINFTDQSTQNPTSWQWTFGDDNTSSEQNPTHTYSKTGTYTVNLSVSNDFGVNERIKQDFIIVNRETSTVSDVNGNVYKTVKIGEQWWMAENLKATHSPTGTAIPLITDGSEWFDLHNRWNDKGYCYYGNNSASTYGALYNYAAAVEVCPSGWHLPSDAEWAELKNYVANDGYSGREGSALKSTTGWSYYGNGNDAYGFNALGSGIRMYSIDFDASFSHAGLWAFYWCSDEVVSNGQASLAKYIHLKDSKFNPGSYYKSRGLSIRCIKN